MPYTRKPPVKNSPRGVVKKVIALRLLAPELAKHETLCEQAGRSSAAFARDMYLLGLASLEKPTVSQTVGRGINTAPGVNRT